MLSSLNKFIGPIFKEAMKSRPATNYAYDDHTSIPFKFVVLKPSANDETERAHRHNFFQLFFLTTDGGKHLIDFEEQDFKANSVHIVNPGSIHKVSRTNQTNGFVLLFSRNFVNPRLEESSLFLYRNDFNKFLKLDALNFQEILRYLGKIQQEGAATNAFQQQGIQSLLELILIDIQRQLTFETAHMANDTDLLFDHFKSLVSQHFTKQSTLHFYAEHLNISTEKLNKICKSKVNKTASTLLQERILLEAKRLLFHASFSVKEIAFQLGFEDPSYFNRFFKQKIGETPKSFRLAIREKYHE